MNYPSLVQKTAAAPGGVLSDTENPFSTNKVTGYSLNFPIADTCSPTKVCVKTCYFGRGPSTWTPSLSKQVRLLNRLNEDPSGLGMQIARWARRLRLTFVRWHGGGDMTERSPECIDVAALAMPNIPQWVVTRRPWLAAKIVPRPNVFVHFSTDRSSRHRLDEFVRRLSPEQRQWFWSYQCDRGEVPPANVAPIVFRDCYRPLPGEQPAANDCPLNWTDDICGLCEKCRRCFNGEAVEGGVALAAAGR